MYSSRLPMAATFSSFFCTRPAKTLIPPIGTPTFFATWLLGLNDLFDVADAEAARKEIDLLNDLYRTSSNFLV